MTTLARIQTKVRRLTSSPSPNQLPDATINEYIDDFYLYDLPKHLWLKSLLTNYRFWTQPNVDRYSFPTNQYITVQPPLYIAGFQSLYTQSETQFYNIYPKVQTRRQVATGNGASIYNFTISSTPFLQNDVLITGSDGTTTLNLIDIPTSNTTGNLVLEGTTAPILGTINYVTGVTSITSGFSIANGQPINASVVFYEASRPNSMLFFHNEFVLRPVPDGGYEVELEAYIRPTAFIDSIPDPMAQPELIDWWEYIAFGTARKILIDRKDLGTLQAIEPYYEEQKRLVLRRTIVQQSIERSSTIYSEQADFAYAQNNYNNRF